MKVLHINSEYSTNKLYKNLLCELGLLKIDQINYASIKNDSQNGNNSFEDDTIEFNYSKTLKFYHRFFYYRKINFLLKDIEDKCDLVNVNVIHAHKLFSDGGVALKIKQKYSIPYIVAIRSTDIYGFYKYMPYLKSYAEKILLNADKIILLNNHFRTELNKLHTSSFPKLDQNIQLIPNGIDEVWFKNREIFGNRKVLKPDDCVQIVYTGTFIKRKKVVDLLKAICILNEKGINTKLTLIGAGGHYQQDVEDYSKKYSFIHYEGKLSLEEIRKVYKRMHIFAMPSVKETFGLVYIEALSQGLPILYTKYEAIDSFFSDGKVGYGIDPNNLDDIVEKLKMLIENFECISGNVNLINLDQFKWEQVARKYSSIYNKISK